MNNKELIKKLTEISDSGRTVEMVLKNSRGANDFHTTMIDHEVTKEGLVKFHMVEAEDIPFKSTDIQLLSVMTTVFNKNERVIQIHGHGFTEFFRNDDDFNHVNKFSQFGFEKLGLKNFKDLTDFCDKQETDTLGTIHGGTFPELYLTNGGAK